MNHQFETAKAEVNKSFPQGAELSGKMESLTECMLYLALMKSRSMIGMDDEAELERKLVD